MRVKTFQISKQLNEVCEFVIVISNVICYYVELERLFVV